MTNPAHDDGILRADGSADSAHRITLGYIDRSRRYYRSKGYTTPYRWATHEDVPFTPVTKPMSQSRLAVVTTAFPHEQRDHDGARPAKEIRAVPTDPRPDTMYTNDLFWHKTATDTDDVESFLPLRTLAGFVADGRLGSLNHRFYCVPTTYSQRSTNADAETIAAMVDEDDVDLVLLIPL